MPEFEALARITKEKRKEFQETQLDFGINCGLSEDEICNIENQNTDPKLSTIQSIATYTGLTVPELLTVKEEKNVAILQNG